MWAADHVCLMEQEMLHHLYRPRLVAPVSPSDSQEHITYWPITLHPEIVWLLERLLVTNATQRYIFPCLVPWGEFVVSCCRNKDCSPILFVDYPRVQPLMIVSTTLSTTEETLVFLRGLYEDYWSPQDRIFFYSDCPPIINPRRRSRVQARLPVNSVLRKSCRPCSPKKLKCKSHLIS